MGVVVNIVKDLFVISLACLSVVEVASAQSTENLRDFGTVKELWGSQGSNIVYVGTTVSSARHWYEDPMRGTEYSTFEPPFSYPLEVLSLGATKYSAVLEFATPAATRGKDWFIAINPSSIYLGVVAGQGFTASFYHGDGYVTLKDQSMSSLWVANFSVTDDYSLWAQPIGPGYRSFSDASVNYGFGWSGQVSRGSVLLRVPDVFLPGELASLRIDVDAGGLLFNQPILMALENSSNADILQASNVFPAVTVPEPEPATLFLAGLLALGIWQRTNRAQFVATRP